MGAGHVDPPKRGGGAPFLSPFRRLTPRRASIRRNHSGDNPIANRGLGNGTQKAWEMGSNSISHARRTPGLGNGVPNFGQFSSEESASNPPLARAAISRNSQISEGLIRGQSSTVKSVPIPDHRAELLEAVALAEFPADLNRAA